MSSYVPPPPCATNNGLYNCMQPELVAARHRARESMYRYNTFPPTRDGRERREMLAELFCVPVESMPNVYIEPP
ncbi:hypothetical protein BDZ89DRAFT_1076732 [Hymenopellis radicata]|nr:hypothetical protein BDZ89DRAFT_1076732 [Hymenopellis radicata]